MKLNSGVNCFVQLVLVQKNVYDEAVIKKLMDVLDLVPWETIDTFRLSFRLLTLEKEGKRS